MTMRAAVQIATAPLIKAEGIFKAYAGTPALQDCRIDVEAGSVHALCGGNGAGKSTLLRILTGLESPDAGRVWIKGFELRFASPAAALAAGVAIITQELSPVLDMTVAENLYLGREPRRARWLVDRDAMESQAQTLFERLHFRVDPRARMRGLPQGQVQLVEIAKAIGRDSSVLIMDEPTSAIGEQETTALFEAIAELKARQVGIIYVSHRFSELFSIADRYTVLRDGRCVQSGLMRDIDRQELIRLIVGRSLIERPVEQTAPETSVLLQVNDFTRRGEFEHIDLVLKRGEILGLYGLLGAGRSAFANALYGMSGRIAGSVSIEGRAVKIDSPADAIRHGMAMITEDRKNTGLVLARSVRENISLSSLPALDRWGVLKLRAESALVEQLMRRFNISARNGSQCVRQLSGGNQQKVVFARAMGTAPRILICDEPTRGIDEESKREIYAFLARYAARGYGVLLISSEIPELLANCHRIIVFRGGRAVAKVAAGDATAAQLVHYAS